MTWSPLRRAGARAADAPIRRATFRSPEEVPCATGVLQLFHPAARPEVVAYRRRTRWTACPPAVGTHEVLAALAADGACEVRLRWRMRTRLLRLR